MILNRSLSIIVIPICVLILSGCASNRPPRFNNYSNKECQHNGNLSYKERLDIYPFNAAAKIQVISFSSAERRAPIENDSVLTSKAKEIITLNTEQITDLTDILYNYNYSKRLQVWSITRNGCYYPRHAVVFLDEHDKVIGYIEYCFQCLGYETDLPMESTGVFCDGKYELLEEYFKKIGITHFEDNPFEGNEPRPE